MNYTPQDEAYLLAAARAHQAHVAHLKALAAAAQAPPCVADAFYRHAAKAYAKYSAAMAHAAAALDESEQVFSANVAHAMCADPSPQT